MVVVVVVGVLVVVVVLVVDDGNKPSNGLFACAVSYSKRRIINPYLTFRYPISPSG